MRGFSVILGTAIFLGALVPAVTLAQIALPTSTPTRTPSPLASPTPSITLSKTTCPSTTRCSTVFQGPVLSFQSASNECQCYLAQSILDGHPTEFITWVLAYVYPVNQNGENIALTAYNQALINKTPVATVCHNLLNSRPWGAGCLLRCRR
jgi:hypothetical protein